MANKKEATAEQNRIAELEKQLAAKDAILQKAAKNGGRVALPVSGSYTAKWKDEITGKQVSKTVAFKDGRTQVRIADGRIVASEALLQLANGEAPSPAYVEQYPALIGLDQEYAEDFLTYLAKMKEVEFLK